MAPCIGITCLISEQELNNPPLVGARRAYIDSVVKAGGVPLLIPPLRENTSLDQLLTRLDGLLIPGGADVEPEHYGEDAHPTSGPFSKERDSAEIRLIHGAIQGGLPILAICRGIQVLNVALGGSLIQDIPSCVPGSLNHPQKNNPSARTSIAHEISIEDGSILHKMLGVDRIGVNSLHHQSIKRLASSLKATARSSDGIVEAVEGMGGEFLVGVQCHPESLWQATEPRWLRLFEEFISRCNQKAATLRH